LIAWHLGLCSLADLGLSKEEAGTDLEKMEKSKMLQEIDLKVVGYKIKNEPDDRSWASIMNEIKK